MTQKCLCELHLYNLFITYLLMCVLHIYMFTHSTQEFVASSKHRRVFLLYLCACVALNRCCFCIPEACMSAVLLSQKMRLYTGWLYPRLKALIHTRDSFSWTSFCMCVDVFRHWIILLHVCIVIYQHGTLETRQTSHLFFGLSVLLTGSHHKAAAIAWHNV